MSMKRSTKAKARGKFLEVKGKLKAKLGRATRNTHLEAEGAGETLGGKLQKKIGQMEKAVGL